MDSATLRLVILISCCHALVHIYEHSFASVEQLVAEQFHVSQSTTGALGMYLGLPLGLFAFAAGWLSDRFGAKRLLLVYLFGCSAMLALAAFAGLALGLVMLGVSLFLMGSFAAIYHPAGVGLISHETHPQNRPMALGYHGIFGSAGIAAGPFIAAIVLATGVPWWAYFLVLAVPGVVLAVVLMTMFTHRHEASSGTPVRREGATGVSPMLASAGASPDEDESASSDADEIVPLETTAANGASNTSGAEPPDEPPPDHAENHSRWDCYVLLVAAMLPAGMIYRAVLTFLPRYLDHSGFDLTIIPPESLRNFLTGFVLILGIIGQYVAGRIARHETLEPLMALTFVLVSPVLLWMGVASGAWRIVAAGLFAVLFFMHQPVLNSLVAKYSSRRRRSLAYGMSFTLGFGVGSYGSKLAGDLQARWGDSGTLASYSVLAAMALLVAALTTAAWWRYRRAG